MSMMAGPSHWPFASMRAAPWRLGGVQRRDAAVHGEQAARLAAEQAGILDQQGFQFHPGTFRVRRVRMSRHAMRTATPISTCSVIVERAGSSATLLSISTPRFIGPDRKSVV